jgi:hypothetical protein
MFVWKIEEVEEDNNLTCLSGGGEVSLQDLEVANLPNLEITETNQDVALIPIFGGEVEKLEKLEAKAKDSPKKNYFDGGKKFNQIMVAILVGLIVVPMMFIFVIVAINDIRQGKLDLTTYVSLIGSLIAIIGTFLAGLGVGNYISGKPKTESG